MDSIRGVDSVTQTDGVMKVVSDEEEKEIDGEIVHIDGADVVSISDYFGNEVSMIEPSDIVDMNPTVLTLACDSAQQITNRVVIDFQDGRTVEINGKIESAES